MLLAQPAFGASQRDHNDCTYGSGDVAIAACTRVINDRNESPRKLADAYTNRSCRWATKGNLDRAVADGAAAIRLDPESP
jgi:hypothetical protein